MATKVLKTYHKIENQNLKLKIERKIFKMNKFLILIRSEFEKRKRFYELTNEVLDQYTKRFINTKRVSSNTS